MQSILSVVVHKVYVAEQLEFFIVSSTVVCIKIRLANRRHCALYKFIIYLFKGDCPRKETEDIKLTAKLLKAQARLIK